MHCAIPPSLCLNRYVAGPHTTHSVARRRQSRHWSDQGLSCFPFLLSYIALSVVSGHIQKATDKPSRTFTVAVAVLESSGTLYLCFSKPLASWSCESVALRVPVLQGVASLCYTTYSYTFCSTFMFMTYKLQLLNP